MNLFEAAIDVLKPKSREEIISIAKKLLGSSDKKQNEAVIKAVYNFDLDSKELENMVSDAFDKHDSNFIHNLLSDMPNSETNLFKEAIRKIESPQQMYKILNSSARKGFIDAVKYFVDEKNLDPKNDRSYPLRWAAFYGHKNVVEYLLNKGADPSDFKEKELVKLAKRKQFDILNLLGYEG